MSLLLPPVASNLADFSRKVATAVNSLLRGEVFPPSSTAPPNPKLGQGYFDTSTNKAKVWNGTAWQALW